MVAVVAWILMSKGVRGKSVLVECFVLSVAFLLDSTGVLEFRCALCNCGVVVENEQCT